MKKLLLALLLLALFSGAALLALWVALATPDHGVHLIVNDHEWNLGASSGWRGVAGGLAVLAAVCAVALAIPLAVLLGVLLPLLLVLGAVMLILGAVMGIGALALSPLVVPLLLLWWLWRRSRSAAPRADDTIDA